MLAFNQTRKIEILNPYFFQMRPRMHPLVRDRTNSYA